MQTHVDRGGTFTDVVVIDDEGHVHLDKVPSDVAVVGELARGALTFGTTVATNALLERRGARTALFVTEGFADLPWLGDQARPELFDADARWPEPLVDRVFEVRGRLDADGTEIEPLEIPPDIDLQGFEAAAVVLVNSHLNPAHELAVAAALPVPFVSLGHRASPELGYLARVETTLVDAAVTPVLQAAMARDRIPAGALAVRSDGSLCPAPSLRAPDAVLSGPAGGVLAVAEVARQAGFAHAVGLDMGGTSTDVCRVDVGALPHREGELRVAGVRLRRPILEVETIAAGGGSILASDGLRFTVGPASAGAHPGPQCYGRGGPPTLTDAALAVGLLDPAAFPLPLDVDAVALPGPPEAFLAIAREAMAQAIRKIATQRGVDLAGHALVAYGGAAGQHAAAVAEQLDLTTVLVHPCASVLCAWGQSLARREESAVAAVWSPLPAGWPTARDALLALQRQLPDLGDARWTAELHHAGTDHALAVPVAADDDGASLIARFDAEHRARYGFTRPGHVVEVVNVRVRVSAPAPARPPVHDDPWGIGDAIIVGPRLITSRTTAVHVPAGWTARRHRGLLRLDRGAAPPAASPPVGLPPRDDPRYLRDVELWKNRFQAVAEDAGGVLQRLARSVNIKERLDFSCAVFDAGGRLVANAPHIPVHLGAMGETVRDLLARHPEVGHDGVAQAWLSNDPASGGSHLPDLTVTTAVVHDGRRWFVACRGHHVDVGGLTPGSMPPTSRSLADEGVVFRQLPLLDAAGGLRDLRPLLAGVRQPETVIADLGAQVAANSHAARLLVALGPADLVDAWMSELHRVAGEAVASLLERLPTGSAEDDLDGIPLRLALTIDSAGLHVDLTGTGGPHPGNLNAPSAVLRAAVMYALRVLAAAPVPLNEGSLERVRATVPAPSVLAPPPDAAVVGGNVETSQRLVDLFFRAAHARAASAGTMNNLTLGGDGWSLYETLGGGLGATATAPGVSGRQLHMTNTRATDVEVLEARLPLRVRRFALYPGSGGDGAQRGGDGLVREIEVTAPATATLLAAWREAGAPGVDGGGPGAPGHAERFDGERWRPWAGEPVALSPGHRVRVYTPGGGGWGAPRALSQPRPPSSSP